MDEKILPMPLSISPLKGEKYDCALPFKGRDGVGMGRLFFS